jgi:hypothetical protein
MMVQRMFRANHHIAKETKPHRGLTLCVVTGGAHGGKRIRGLPAQDQINGAHNAASSTVGCFQSAHGHMRIGIQRPPTLGWGRSAHGIYMGLRMGAQKIIIGGQGRLYPQQIKILQST